MNTTEGEGVHFEKVLRISPVVLGIQISSLGLVYAHWTPQVAFLPI